VVALRGRNSREARLDPVRWRRPGRSALLRSAVVAALVATAAVVMWARPPAGSPAGPSAGSLAEPSAGSFGGSAAGPAGARGNSGPILDAGTPEAQAPAGRSAVPPGSVGVPIRLAEPTALKLVHPGDHVDVFRVGESPQAIATAALVLGVTGADDPATGGLLLALTPTEARRTVTAPAGGYAVLIRPDG
jgi:hypothetical protein